MLETLYGLDDGQPLRRAEVRERPDDKAQKAAEEVASREADIADLKSDMTLVKWMLGAVLAIELAQFVNAVL